MAFAKHPEPLHRRCGRRAWHAGLGLQLAIGIAVGVAAVVAGCGGRAPAPDRKTATVWGRVVDPARQPLAGATVELGPDPPDGRVPLGTAHTSPIGSFHVERIPPGRVRVVARARGYLDGAAAVDVAPIVGGHVDLTLVPAVALTGRIEDRRGARVPLARVLAFAVAEAAAPVLHETRADERGDFKIGGLGPGAHRLLIEVPGLGSASAGPLIAPDDHVVVVMPGESRAIVGRVTRADRPVAGARVLLGGEAVAEVRSETADENGRFAFGGLGPGAYTLRAEAGGLVGPVLTSVIVDRVQRQPQTIDIPVAAGTFVHGRVVAEDGVGVDGAGVQIDGVPATGLWPVVKTDARGAWTSPPLGPGSYRVRAQHVGFVARRTATIDVGKPDDAGAKEAAPVVLELARTGTINGRVVDERGHPLGGAEVSDRLAETEELGVIWSPLPLAAEAAALPSGTAPLASFANRARRVTTGADGGFTLRDVPPGRLRIEILYPTAIPLRAGPVILAPGGAVDLGTLTIARAHVVTGTVVDGQGAPVAGVRVGATRVDAPARSGSTAGAAGAADVEAGLYAITDDAGAFSLPLAEGDHRLTARLPGQPDVEAAVHVTAFGGANAPVILHVAGAPAGGATTGSRVVDGLVRDAAGRPLARARIVVTASRTAASHPLATAVADAGGHFRMTGLPESALWIDVHHPSYAPAGMALPADPPTSSVIVDVPVPGGIDGEVHEKISGAPVPGFEIAAEGPDGAAARFPEPRRAGRTRPRAALRFSLGPLAPGLWTLRVRAPGFKEEARTFDVASASAPGERSLADVRLELERQNVR